MRRRACIGDEMPVDDNPARTFERVRLAGESTGGRFSSFSTWGAGRRGVDRVFLIGDSTTRQGWVEVVGEIGAEGDTARKISNWRLGPAAPVLFAEVAVVVDFVWDLGLTEGTEGFSLPFMG